MFNIDRYTVGETVAFKETIEGGTTYTYSYFVTEIVAIQDGKLFLKNDRIFDAQTIHYTGPMGQTFTSELVPISQKIKMQAKAGTVGRVIRTVTAGGHL